MLFTETAILTDGTPVQRAITPRHLLDFYRADTLRGQTLFITFDYKCDFSDDNRLAWGFAFLKKEGHSVLGVKIRGFYWYRDPALFALFASAEMTALLSTFQQVIFYGESMGGSGALTLVTPGATVLAISPQVSLDPAVVPWETRYEEGRAQDWSGDWTPQAGMARAGVIYVMYDPFFDLDARQVALLTMPNVVRLRMPCVGHGVPDWLVETGLLQNLVRQVAAGSVTPASWRSLAAIRKNDKTYLEAIANKRPSGCAARVIANRELAILMEEVRQRPKHGPLRLRLVDALAKAGYVNEAIALGEQLQREIEYLQNLMQDSGK